MKAVLVFIVAVAALASSLSTFADGPPKAYGTPSPNAIQVIVSDQFKEPGIHYIPKGAKFADFLKSLHEQDDYTRDQSWTVHVVRKGKRVCESYKEILNGFIKQNKKQFEEFVLEDGDSIGMTGYPI